jgi:hypothetical protein
MKTAIAAITVSLLAQVGCAVPVDFGNPAHRLFHGSLAFTQEVRVTIESAMDKMRDQTNGAIQYDIVWDGDRAAANTMSIHEVSPAGYDARILGHAEGSSGRVNIFFVRSEMKSITKEKYENVVRYVALHEMAHAALVFRHTSSGLMTQVATLPLAQCIDRVTMIELQKNVSIPDAIPCDIPTTPSP